MLIGGAGRDGRIFGSDITGSSEFDACTAGRRVPLPEMFVCNVSRRFDHYTP